MHVMAASDLELGVAGLKTYDFYQQDRKPGDPLAASPITSIRTESIRAEPRSSK